MDEWFGTSAAILNGRACIGASGSEATLAHSGAVYLFERDQGSGAWQEVLKLVPSDASAGDLFGRRLAFDGDLLAVPSVFDDDKGIDSGSVYVLDLEPAFIAYGAGCPGTGGIVPQLHLTGYAAAGGTVTVDIQNCVGNGQAFLFLGAHEASIPLGYGCLLNISPLSAGPFGPLPLFPIGATGPGAGSLSFPALIPVGAPATTVTVQAFIRDAGVPAGFANTGGVKMIVE